MSEVSYQDLLVINIVSLGEVANVGCTQIDVIVTLVLCNGMDETTGRVDIAVQNVDDRISGLLSQEGTVKNSGDVLILDPGIKDTRAHCVYYHDSIITVGCNSGDHSVLISVSKFGAICTLAGHCVDEDEAGCGIGCVVCIGLAD